MSATKGFGDMPFIILTSVKKVDPETRKRIRSHVMLGKNRGKSRQATRREPIDAETPNTNEGPHGSSDLDPLSKISPSVIPSKVGSDLSFVQFADAVEPSILADVLTFSSMTKRALFPLEMCIFFDKIDKNAWFQLLASDATYLHAVAFTTQVYFDLVFGRRYGTAGCRGSLQRHFLKTLRLLRERLLLGDERAKVSNPTILVVLGLAINANMMGQYEAAKHHMEGLHKIVHLRGGIGTFRDNVKLLIELFRCDIGMALDSGAAPLFFWDNLSSEPVMPSPAQVGYQYNHSEEFLNIIDDQLAMTWGVMKRFCSQINLVAETNCRLPGESFLDTMTTVMYRLLHMSFETGSIDEAVRLGLLALSSHVFLQWKDVRPSYVDFPATYRNCLANLQAVDGFASYHLLLWLLMVGAISIFTTADDDMWLKPWLRVNMNLCEVTSWNKMRDILDSFLWIGLVHDQPGMDMFDSAFFCSE